MDNINAQGHAISSAERRTFTRIFFDAEAVVLQGEHSWPVELIDVSLRGVLVKKPSDMALELTRAVEISIHLAGDVEICMRGRVKHQEENHLGLQCDFIDLDSMIHLRRLVELNTGDTSLLERELSALG